MSAEWKPDDSESAPRLDNPCFGGAANLCRESRETHDSPSKKCLNSPVKPRNDIKAGDSLTAFSHLPRQLQESLPVFFR